MNVEKIWKEKEFLKWCIGISKSHLTSTDRPALYAGFNGAYQCSPQKDIVGIRLLLVIKVDPNIFFPETCFAYNISEPEFMVCTKLKGSKMVFLLKMSKTSNGRGMLIF